MSDTNTLAHWLVSFPTTQTYFWSGAGELVLDSITYIGAGHIISVGDAEASRDTQDKRLTASLSVADPVLRAELLQDPGPLPVVIEWIYSQDGGVNWVRVPRRLKGRLSRPVIQGGIYQIEVETYSGDVDRGRFVSWSHEEQSRRYPGDRSLEFTREISQGIESRWPP